MDQPRKVTPHRARLAPRGARLDATYQGLRALIIRGQLAPGTRIVETDIAAKLGVSRTPVRAALQRLQHEGFVLGSPGLKQSRQTVAPVTRDDARELFGIVGAIEGLAARRAAMLLLPERHALARTMTDLNQKFRKAAQAPSPDHNLLWELDERFHRSYIAAAAGTRLRTLHDTVKPQAERYERLYVSLLGRHLAPSVAEHNTIVRCIKSGDEDGAQHAVETNWRNAAERVGAVIDLVGERGHW